MDIKPPEGYSDDDFASQADFKEDDEFPPTIPAPQWLIERNAEFHKLPDPNIDEETKRKKVEAFLKQARDHALMTAHYPPSDMDTPSEKARKEREKALKKKQ